MIVTYAAIWGVPSVAKTVSAYQVTVLAASLKCQPQKLLFSAYILLLETTQTRGNSYKEN